MSQKFQKKLREFRQITLMSKKKIYHDLDVRNSQSYFLSGLIRFRPLKSLFIAGGLFRAVFIAGVLFRTVLIAGVLF